MFVRAGAKAGFACRPDKTLTHLALICNPPTPGLVGEPGRGADLPIALDLRAQSSVNGASRLVTTFSTIPDAPVSRFTLQITGGPGRLLVITGRGRSICNEAQVAGANFGAQSGKTIDRSVRMAAPCGKAHKVKRHTRKSEKHGARHGSTGVLWRP